MSISHLSRRLGGLVSNYQVLCHTSLPHLVCLEQIINASFSALSSSSCNSTKLYSTSVAKAEETRNFVASYLTNSCGLSSERAATISSTSLLKFRDKDKPNAVLDLLRDVGFTDTQITKMINEAPRLLSYTNPEKRLLPKFQFFFDVGFDKKDLCQLVYKNPSLMLRSLKHHIIPLYKFIHNVLGTHDKVLSALKRSRDLASVDLNKSLAPNILLLQEIGMPPSVISSFMVYRPRIITRNHSEFKEAVEEALKWGMKPYQTSFFHAVDVCINKGTMDRTIKILKQWDWSDDDIISSFRTHPQFMLISEYKLSRLLDFFINKVGFEMKSIVGYPICMCYSLESRIIPRFSVVKVLLSMGLINKLNTLATVLVPREKHFMDMYVTPFSRMAPDLLSVYQGKVDPF